MVHGYCHTIYGTVCGPDDVVELYKELKSFPAADVVEVRHGEWKETPTGWIYCSVCGSEPPEESNYKSNYCPNCGAKMDGGVNDGKADK
jgi:hypothetical protein